MRLDWYGHAFQYHRLKLESKRFPRLHRLELSGVFLTNGDQEFPPNLEHLRFHAGVANFDFPFPSGPLLTNLKTLMFSDVNWLLPLTLKWFIDNTNGSLRVLWLDSCLKIGSELGELIQAGYFNNLTELNLSRVPKVGDNVLDLIVANMPDLKVIYLSYTAITGRAIKMLADARMSDENTTKVDRIYIKGCEDVSSDAVAYGKARGIEIFA